MLTAAGWGAVAVGLLCVSRRSPLLDRLVVLAARTAAPGAPSLTGTGRSPIPADRWWWALLGCAVVPVATWAGPAAALAILLVGAATVTGRRMVRADRARDRRVATAAVAASAVAAEYRSGATVAAALAAAGRADSPMAAPLRDAARAAAQGLDISASLAGCRELGALAVATVLARRTGCALGPVLDGVVADLDARAASTAEVAAAVAGTRASAGLLALLPLAGVGMAAALGTHPWHVLTRTAWGQAALLSGVVLDILGVFWILLLSRRASR